MAIEIEDKIKRCDNAWKRKSQWDDLYRDAYKYGMPQRNQYETQTEGARKGSEVFDSTAVQGNSRFANRVQSNLCPAFQRWCVFEGGPLVPKVQLGKLNKALQKANERFFAALDISNFQTAFNEFCQDLGAGTGIMYVEEDFDGARPGIMRCTAVAPIEVALEEGPYGTVEGVYRRHCMAGRLVKRTWKDAVLPADLEKIITDDPNADVTLEECTYYEPDRGLYEYDVIWKTGKGSILRRPRTYKENPWIVVRWTKASNEVWGRGPLVMGLADIKTLNKLMELVLKNASIAVSGVYTGVNDGVLNPNTVKIVPGAIIPVASNGGARGPSLQPLKSSADFNIAQVEMDELRMSIKKTMMDNTLPPDAGPVRSPTEIAARLKELAEEIGSAFGRLMFEFVQPFVQRVLGIMDRAGLLADIGPVKITGYLVQIRVTSPLARLQNAQDVEAVLNWLAAIGQLGPELVALGAKVEDLPAWLGTKLGVPAELIRDEGEKDELKKMVASMVAQQVAAANQNAAGAQQAPQPQTQAQPVPQRTPARRAA